MTVASELTLTSTTAGGFLLVLAVFVPVVGMLTAFSTGGRQVARVGLVTVGFGLLVAGATGVRWLQAGEPLVYVLGRWMPPLGVALRADGPAVVMMAVVAVVMAAVAVFARASFETPADVGEARRPFAFWILLLGVWAGLNAVFLSGDLFTLYVALELITFAAVPLVSLDGRAETLAAALRYLLFALLGSILYLGGAGILYGAYGTLDIVLLAGRVESATATRVAGALMTVGMLAKTALVPLHLWLPPAHAGAPAAASAVLSALVVKGSFFVVVRLWFGAMPGLPGFGAAQLLSGLGAAAILLGSVVALRQQRLKLLVAYSTLAQIGYLFLVFALALDPASSRIEAGGALTGGMLQAITHAMAKAAMFLSAGMIYAGLGHDRIDGLAGSFRTMPVCVLAFGLGGLALMGMPPSGAALAKDLLVRASGDTGQWWWAVVLDVGGALTSSYVLLVLAHALRPAREPSTTRVPWTQQLAALALAMGALMLGLLPWGAFLIVPEGAASTTSGFASVWKMLLPVLAGGALAGLLGHWGEAWPRPSRVGVLAAVRPVRRAAAVVGRAFEGADLALRRWPVATQALLLLAILFSLAFLAPDTPR